MAQDYTEDHGDFEISCRLSFKRKYLDHPISEMHEAAKSGDAVLLDEVLQEINGSESSADSDLDSAKTDALLLAVIHRNLNCVKVVLKFNANIEGPYSESTEKLEEYEDDPDYYSSGSTPLFIAAATGDLEIMRLFLKNGAEVNACDDEGCTPLMIASNNSHVNVIKLLIERGANVGLQDKDGKVAIHHAVCNDYKDCNSVEVLSCLIENGADVNARANDNCTPLMLGSRNDCHVDLLKFLVTHGAKIDLQDENGDTALHYAINGKSSKVFYSLLNLGATLLYNNCRLTPLLLASNESRGLTVMDLIGTLDFTKNERVDAIELLGASLATRRYAPNFESGFYYMKLGMEERFSDPSNPSLKQPMEPVEAYQNRKESQTLEELAQIENNLDDMFMESLVIKERILGKDNIALLYSITSVADYYSRHDINDIGMFVTLYEHAIKIAQGCNESASRLLDNLVSVLVERAWYDVAPNPNDVLETLKLIVLEYERQEKMKREAESGSNKISQGFDWGDRYKLFRSSLKLVQIIGKYKLCNDLHVSMMLKRLLHRNPHMYSGNTFLHEAVVEKGLSGSTACPDTVRILLNKGINVNAINNNGDTPLHRAVTLQPSVDKIHLLTEILELLFDGGAHHDFVNNDGKTPMDMAQTDEARRILSERRKLELKCISARAVKKFGIPYLGQVPAILEKYIKMH